MGPLSSLVLIVASDPLFPSSSYVFISTSFQTFVCEARCTVQQHSTGLAGYRVDFGKLAWHSA